MTRRFIYTLTLALALVQIALAQTNVITGTVKDAQGQPIFGVFVLIKGTQHGTSTDMDGKYSLSAQVGQTLVFSYLGMKTVERKVGTNTTHLDIVLQDDVQELEGTVVMGYGQKKVASKTVGLAAVVGGKEIKEVPTSNALDALQGKVAGAVITTSSGSPGSSSKITIHGLNTIGGFLGGDDISSPLYVIDGVPVSGSVMVNYNPEDIESITVLKDAASTSIYGSRAANGVIYITTKRGHKNERTTVSINHQLGFSTIANRKFFDNLMSPREYMDFWIDYTSNLADTDQKKMTPELANKILEENPYHTAWDKVYFRNFVPMYRTNVSVSGGGEKVSYYLSASYLDQEGVKYGSGYKRYTLNSNVDADVSSWLKVGANISLSHNDVDDSAMGAATVGSARVLAMPYYRPKDSNGQDKQLIGIESSDPAIINKYKDNTFYHPKYLADTHPGGTQGQEIIPTIYAQLEPIKNLVFKTQVGLQHSVYNSTDSELPSVIIPRPNIHLTRTQSMATRKNFTNTLEYKFSLLNKHYLTALLGQESIENSSQSVSVSSYNQPTDELMMLSKGDNFNVIDTKGVDTFNSFFARVDYEYNNRYFLDVSARRDGSSSFGQNNRYATFWAIGGMWKLSNEAFLKDVSWLSDLSLRVSTGSAGNAPSSYSNITQLNMLRYNGSWGYGLDRRSYGIGNPNLRWERQNKTTVGLSGYLFGSTSFNVEYYYRETRDMLFSKQLNTAVGYDSYNTNVGSLRNAGVDVTLSSVVYRNKEHNVSIRPYLNFNYNSQKVLSLYENRDSYLGGSTNNWGYAIGSPIYWAMPIFKGINPETGLREFYKPGEDRMTTHTDDNDVSNSYDYETLKQNTGKKRQAPLNGGFGFSATYKTLSLETNFSFSYGRYILNEDLRQTENAYNALGIHNLSRNVTDFWKQKGDKVHLPSRGTTVFNNSGDDTRMLEDASYIRLKNASLSYSLPQAALDQLKFFSNLRFYVAVHNILTFTKFTGADPEFPQSIATGGYPPSREYSMGIEMKF